MADATVTMKFRWMTISPDSHNKTMRNTLEPIDVFVQVEVPLKHEYIANSESIIKAQLGVNKEKEPLPILTREGMKFAIDQLSLEVAPEAVSEEEWNEGENETVEDWDKEADDDNWGEE